MWPQRPGQLGWPITIPAEASLTFAFQVASRGNPAGAAPLTVSATTSSGHTVSSGSSAITAVASVAGTLVIPVDEDTWVEETNPDANHGSEGSFDVQGGNGVPNSRWRGLLKFDLGSIPAGSTVTGATLRLGTSEGFSYNGDVNHYGLVVADTWSEGTVTWTTRPADGFTGAIPDAPASVLTEANADFLGGGDVFYGLPNYAIVPHIHTIPRPSQAGALATRLAQRVQTESIGDDTLSIEIVNPCCGPGLTGYWARYGSSEGGSQDLRPALVLTLSGGGGPATVVTTTADSGAGSLRQAILDANAQAGEQTITFNISVPEVGAKVIALQTALPAITGPVTIDGTTQPGYVVAPNTPPMVVLDGSDPGVVGTGLTVAAGGNGTVIRALSITNFNPAPAAAIDAGAADVLVDRSYIGVRPNGTTVGANGVGILVRGPDAFIGASGIGQGNLIVASQDAGVELEGSAAQVVGNVISAVTGVAGSGNAVGIFNDGATGSEITANGITSSSGDGVVIGGGSAGVDILNNSISANAGLGIDTRNDGVTENDPPGPVDHENFPRVVSSTPNGANLDVVVQFLARGRLPNESYRLELFGNAACDSSGNGEGDRRLGAAANVTTNVDGFATQTFVVPGTTTGALTATATPLAAGNNRSTSEFSDCLVIGGGGPGGVTLDAVQASVPSTGVVPLASVPGSAFVARPPGATQANPIKEIPIKDIPIKDIPIKDIPITDIPITDIGFASGAVLPLLQAFPLSELPLLRPGGWPAVLIGTPFAATPLQNVSLGDALALPAIRALAIDLSDLDLSRSRLGSLPAVAVALGNVTLGSLPLPGNGNWCALASVPTCNASSTVLSISIQGAPITDIPITEIPITDIPITDIPIKDIPITDIPIKDIPIKDIPITDIPITDIPITDIPGNPLINCNVRPCAGATLYDAFVNDWFLPTATLGQLLAALPEPNAVTFADVLVLLFSSTSALGWEEIDLERAGLQAAAGGANAVDWNADVQLTSASVNATVTLPKGFVYDSTTPATVRVLPAGPALPLPQPVIGTAANGDVTLRWTLVGALGQTLRISFQTFPALRVGPQAGTLAAAPASGSPATSDPASISVTETFEPNGEGSPEPVSPASLYLSYVTTADDLDFYSLPAPPIGSTIRVYLSHLPADYDLALYAPADAQMRPEVAGTEPLDSPPLGDEGVPVATEQAALSPETLDDLRLDPGKPLVGVSANRAREDESVVAISGGGSGNYLIQVTPYNGATSAEPYMLRVEVEAPRVPLTSAALPGSPGTAGTVQTLPTGTNTLFLWNRSQLERLYGAGAGSSVLAGMQATQTELTSLGFPSAIVGVDANAGVSGAMATWNADPGSPAKANAVVRAINAVVDGLRGQPNGAGIRYLVLVGGDRVIPFARLEDYTTIANEAGYAQSLGTGNELTAALGAGTMLSDDAYADTSPVQYLNRQLFVPNLAVGRLVETPGQIVAALTRYRDFDGRLDPTTGRVAGYDFLRDGAEQVRQELDARAGVNSPAEPTLIGDAWTRQNLIDALLPATPPGLASLNGHADHFRLMPPSPANATTRPQPFTTTDLTATAAATLPNRLVFSMGCHAGLSVADAIVGQQALDWPQAYSAEGATYLGNTTFGYGDSLVVAYSEELNRLLAEQIRAGGPIGDALRLAKQAYFSTRGVFGVYDEKAMAAFTLYGLPMWSIGAVPQAQSAETEGGVQTLEQSASAAPLAIPTTTTGTDPVTGLAVEAFDATPAFTSVPAGANGSFLRGDSGVQVSHLRPIQPKLVIELTGTQGHGALVTGLTSSDANGVDPVYARPIVDQAGDEPELAFNDVAYPSKLLTVRSFLVAAGERQRLVVGTGQFFGNPAVDDTGTGTQRRYTRIAGHVYRSTSTDRLAPTFTKIDAFLVNGNAAFSVEAAGGDVRRVLVGYRSGTANAWQFVDLAQGAGGLWSGGGTVVGNQFEYFVQAVDEAGNVGVSTNKGFYYDGAALPPDPTPSGPLELEPPAPSGEQGWYTGSVVVSVNGPEGVPVQVSVDGGPFVAPGQDGSVTVSGDGVHLVRARAATGVTDAIVVPIDTTAPDVVFATPAAGASYEPGSTQRAAYECVDPGAGATVCNGTVAVGTPISTTPPGQKTFSVQVRDRAGNTATRTVTYTIAYRKILFTSQRTGAGDIYAVGRDGSGLTRLTTHAAPDTEPAWSPDGRKIAFASRRDGLDLDVYVMNADGSSVVRLTNAKGDDNAPAWSPDGTRIVFQSIRDKNVELYVMNANGTNQLRLTNHTQLDTNPTWSPDGAKIAWTRGAAAATEIYSMNVNGTGIVRLTTDGRDPNWGTNGKIVFTRSLVGAFVWEVFTMNAANGSGVTRLTNVAGPDYDPAWSRDAQQIVFASGRDGGTNLELYVMDPSGANQQRVTTHAAIDRTPDW